MDMDGMNMGTTGTMMMKPYLHFTPGDALWLMEWTPTSPGAVFGACLGLFFIAMVERLLLAMKGVMEAWWRRKTEAILARQLRISRPPGTPTSCDEAKELPQNETANSSSTSLIPAPSRVLPPFILSHDLTRAGITVVRAAIGYVLMLAVMTFNASFIISILIGTFSGELLFGRFTALADGHHA